MKKKVLIGSICALSLGICTFAGCTTITQGDESKLPEYSGQHGEQEQGSLLPENDVITLDGVLDESVYEGQEWLDVTAPGTLREDSVGCRGVGVKATTVYGQEGVYLAFDVSNSFVYVDLDHVRKGWKDSGLSVYLQDALGLKYEICLAADGYIFMQTGHPLVGMACVGTIKGEVNTADATGYVLETYLPWEALGYDEAQAALQMDIAVVVSTDTQGERNGWESLGGSLKSGWSWNNPSTYWTWGAGGFESTPLELSIEDYDETAGSVAFAKDSYQAGDDVVINVSANQGYAVQSVIVNGTQMRDSVADGKLTLSKYGGNRKISVTAQFLKLGETETFTVSGRLTAVAGASAPWAVPADTSVTFAGEALYGAKTGADGAYSIELPAGKYTVTAEGYLSQEIEISESCTKDLQLRFDLLSDAGSAFKVSEDESSAQMTNSGWSRFDFNKLAEQFTLSFTIRAVNGVYASGNNAGIIVDEGGESRWVLQCLNWNNELYGKLTERRDGVESGPDVDYVEYKMIANGYATLDDLNANGQKIMLVRDGDVFTYYLYSSVKQTYVKIHTFEPEVLRAVQLTSWSENLVMENISYAPNFDEISVRIGEVSKEGEGTVALADSYKIGEDVVLNIKPEEGYQIASVSVNGAPVIAENGTVRLENCGFTTLDVEVRFTLIPAKKYDVSGTFKATAGVSGEWNIPAGVKVTFVSADGQYDTTIGEMGAYALELPAGEYTVTAEGYSSASLIVGEAALTKDFTVSYALLQQTAGWTEDAASGTISSTAAKTYALLNINSEKFVLKFTMSGAGGAEFPDRNGPGIFVHDGNTQRQWQVLRWGQFVVKRADINTEILQLTKDGIHGTVDEYKNGVDCMLVRDGNIFTLFIWSFRNNGWVEAESFSPAQYNGVSFRVWDLGVEFTKVSYTPDLAQAEITLGEVSKEGNGSVALGGNYLLGDDVEINVTPETGYQIASLIVNGKQATVEDGKAVLPSCGWTTIDIEVRFTLIPAEKYAVSGTFKATAGASGEWNIPAGVKVSFVSADGQYDTTIGETGAYALELPAGEYTVTAEGYSSASLIVGEAAMTKNFTVRFDLLSDNDDCTISQNEDEARSSVQKSLLAFNTLSEQFVLFYTAKAIDGNYSGNIYMHIKYAGSDGYYQLQNLNWSNNLYAKRNPVNIAGESASEVVLSKLGYLTPAQVNADGWQNLLVRDGNSLYWYSYAAQLGRWVKTHTMSAVNFSLLEICFDNVNICYTDIAYTPYLDGIAIALGEISKEGEGTVALADSYMLGDDVVLNVVPEAGYQVASLKVNGTEVAVEDGKAIIQGCGYMTLDVEVRFTLIPAEKYAVSGTFKATAGASGEWNIPAGVKVSFVGSDGQYETTIGEMGAYALELPAGEYTVTAQGYTSASLSVSGETVKNFTVRYLLIQETAGWVADETHSAVYSEQASSNINLNVSSEQFVLKFTISGTDGTEFPDRKGAGVFIAADVQTQWQILRWGKFVVKNGGTEIFQITQDNVHGTVDDYKNGVDCMLVYDGTVFTFYVWSVTGNDWVEAASYTASEFTNVGFRTWELGLAFTDISYTPYLPEEN